MLKIPRLSFPFAHEKGAFHYISIILPLSPLYSFLIMHRNGMVFLRSHSDRL